MKWLACLAVMLAGALSVSAGEETEWFDATVKAYRTSDVNARVIGNVSEILAKEGQRVNAGDVLARLDDSVQRARYDLAVLEAANETALESAKLQLEQAGRDLNRAKAIEETLSSQQIEAVKYSFDVADNAVKAREQQVAQAVAAAALQKASLDEYQVLAPFDGIVAAKIMEVGETTYPVDKTLFQIIDLSKVSLRVTVKIELLARLKVGQKVTVKSDLYPERIFEGTVSFLSPSAERGGKYFIAKVILDNPDEALRPEMEARAAFVEPEVEDPGEPPKEASSDAPADAVQ